MAERFLTRSVGREAIDKTERLAGHRGASSAREKVGEPEKRLDAPAEDEVRRIVAIVADR